MKKKLLSFVGDQHYQKHRMWLLAVTATLVLLCDLLIDKAHGEFPWSIPGWYALFGFCACLIIIVVAKFLGHACGIMQNEHYYDDKPKSPKDKPGEPE